MKKIIAMIPARLGSKRIEKKNLRLIDGQPLISYVIDSVVSSKSFDEIYLNSEADIFKNIADEKGIFKHIWGSSYFLNLVKGVLRFILSG